MRTLFGLIIIATVIGLTSCEKDTPPPEGQYSLKFVISGSSEKYAVNSTYNLINSENALNDTIEENTSLEFVAYDLSNFMLYVCSLDDSDDAYVEIDCYKNGKFITKIIGSDPASIYITRIYYE